MKNRFNNLKGMCCYLAGNLENVSDQESSDWRGYVTKEFDKLGIICLDPKIQCFTNQIDENSESVKFLKKLLANGKYDKVHDFTQRIIRRDLRMVDRADFLILSIR